ncbi:unnamed protein product [Orchesella dallaii]|uniref:Odorant receptor n=1 Tax=Orchesella dallaii TaxID=48710 RepID=A0ABP1QVJ7_9HEXA
MLPKSIEKHIAIRVRLLAITGQTLFKWDSESGSVVPANPYMSLHYIYCLMPAYLYCLFLAVNLYFRLNPLNSIEDEVEVVSDPRNFATLVLHWAEMIVAFIVCILSTLLVLRRDQVMYLMNQLLIFNRQLIADDEEKGIELDAEQKRTLKTGEIILCLTAYISAIYPFVLLFVMLHPIEPTHALLEKLLEIDLSPSNFGIPHFLLLAAVFFGLWCSDQRPTKGDAYIAAAIKMFTISSIAMPLSYHLDIIRNPCFPVYAGYSLSVQCHNDIGNHKQLMPTYWSASEIGTRLGICFLSYVNWNFLVTGTASFVTLSIVLVGHYFRTCVAQYGTFRGVVAPFKQLLLLNYPVLFGRLVNLSGEFIDVEDKLVPRRTLYKKSVKSCAIFYVGEVYPFYTIDKNVFSQVYK